MTNQTHTGQSVGSTEELDLRPQTSEHVTCSIMVSYLYAINILQVKNWSLRGELLIIGAYYFCGVLMKSHPVM